jgi:hypothetical protein
MSETAHWQSTALGLIRTIEFYAQFVFCVVADGSGRQRRRQPQNRTSMREWAHQHWPVLFASARQPRMCGPAASRLSALLLFAAIIIIIITIVAGAASAATAPFSIFASNQIECPKSAC